MKQLNLEQMVKFQGGRNMVACLSQGVAGASILMTIGAGAAGFALGPVGFITLGLSIASFAGSVYSDPRACD